MAKIKAVTRFSDLLVSRGWLTAARLAEANQEAEAAGQRLEQYLLDQKLIAPEHLLLALSAYLDVAPLSLARFTPPDTVLDLVPRRTLQQLRLVPVSRCGNQLTVAMADPFDLMAIETLHSLTQCEIVPTVAAEQEVLDVLQRTQKETTQGLEEILKDVGEGDVEVGSEESDNISLDEMTEMAEEAPVIRIVNSIMVEALRRKASDIHIEPLEKSLRLRYRIDGVLYENPSPPKRLHPAICSRIKILSNLNIAERRVPQDGRFKIKAMNREADVRVSILPTVHGEKIVMRILDKSNLAPGLAHLGLEQQAYENFKYAISQPYGMLLVTGPTGSGKTTTLYSCLQDLNQIDVNISTVEDPVEYQLSGVNQIQTHTEIGMSFAAALRSLLRQDPDIIMVGEIRDGETAEIAVKAALTGHLVLSTLHTNDAAGAIARLNNMGLEPFLLASSVIMTQAQRLYRRLCTVCRKPSAFPEDLLRLSHIDPESMRDVTFYDAVGCPKCNGLGYKGRAALMEILMVTEEVRAQIMRDPNAEEIRRIAVKGGMQTLRMLGMVRLREGISSLEEILRVTTGD
ncbi:MAG: Flp pilus assembly complex ATPase component TadA [Candidatus Marinimicrobia bacterium]|nr:Flp pilus assembly complex ATPase component TadA [Candidatus Neomarinimicrobiota bacterium]